MGNASRPNWPAMNATSGASTCNEKSRSVHCFFAATRPLTHLLKSIAMTPKEPLYARRQPVEKEMSVNHYDRKGIARSPEPARKSRAPPLGAVYLRPPQASDALR